MCDVSTIIALFETVVPFGNPAYPPEELGPWAKTLTCSVLQDDITEYVSFASNSMHIGVCFKNCQVLRKLLQTAKDGLGTNGKKPANQLMYLFNDTSVDISCAFCYVRVDNKSIRVFCVDLSILDSKELFEGEVVPVSSALLAAHSAERLIEFLNQYQ
jgi:hypothetical protein